MTETRLKWVHKNCGQVFGVLAMGDAETNFQTYCPNCGTFRPREEFLLLSSHLIDSKPNKTQNTNG